jgi:hypothetical protein
VKIKTSDHQKWFAALWYACETGGNIRCLVLRGRGIRRRWVVTAFTAAALTLPGVAFAQTGGLIDQYIEDVPTSGGTHHAGTGSSEAGGTPSGAMTPAPLPTDVKTRLDDKGGKDSEILQEIATSPRYGAPLATSGTVPTPTSSPDPLSAGVAAVTDGSDGRMVGLFVALLAVTAVSLGIAASRRRPN